MCVNFSMITSKLPTVILRSIYFFFAADLAICTVYTGQGSASLYNCDNPKQLSRCFHKALVNRLLEANYQLATFSIINSTAISITCMSVSQPIRPVLFEKAM